MVHHHRQFDEEHVASSTSLEIIRNKRFKDPGMVRSRIFSKVDTTARDKAAAKRKKTTEEGHIVFNHLDETPEILFVVANIWILTSIIILPKL